MHRKAALLGILISIAFSIVPIAAEASWNTAVSRFSSSEELRPYKMEVLSRTYNGRGEIEKTENMLFQLSYDANGESINELIWASENGVDVTEKKKKEDRNHSGGGPPGNSEGFDKSPFDPANQDDLTASDTGKVQYRRGERCSLWTFRLMLNDDHDAAGRAWISLSTGAAVSLEYQIEPNFPFVDEMNIGLNYTTDSSGHWLLEEFRFEGRVNMIIVKKGFDSVTSFSEYR